MLFGNKTDKKKAADTEGPGQPISVYFVPIIAVAIVCVVGVGAFSYWILGQNAGTQQEQNARLSVVALSRHVQTLIDGKRALLKVVGTDPGVVDALVQDSPAQLARATQQVRQRIPAALEIQLVSSARGSDGLLKGMTGGFATQDLIRRTIEQGKPLMVEAHQLTTETPYVAIAEPIILDSGVIGALYANFPISLIKDPVEQLMLAQGAVALVQKTGGESVLLTKTKGYSESRVLARENIAGSLWGVHYSGAGGVASDTAKLFGLVLLAVLGILGVIWVQERKLAKDVKKDMGMTVTLMDATLRRKGTPTTMPKLKESTSAIAIMVKYAQAAYAASKAADADKNKAGKPQTVLVENAREDRLPQQVQKTAEGLHDLPESIFRAYDIRGIAGETLVADTAQLLGQAAGTLALQDGEKSIILGRDVRLSSPDLSSALAAGILSTGCDVIDLGEVPVPVVYFGTHILASRSGVMVTGGHNPPEYNGFKIVIGGAHISEQGLQDLREQMISGDFRTGSGTLHNKDISGEYIRKITTDVQLTAPRKIVVDGGNGAAGQLMVRLLTELGCEVIELFCDPDGAFPNHDNDPGQPENLSALAMEVQAQEADLGIAFDADGDRLGLVDEKGKYVFADQLLMLLADDIVRRHPGADVVYDVKSSGNLASHILSHGGRPIMWKSGHTRIKSKMRETGALLGGSFSGHIYIRERWFGFDDALYATARLLEIFATESQPVSRFFQDLPRSVGTPEIRMPLKEGEAFELLDNLKRAADFKDADIIDTDGIRVEFADGWGLVKASNTMPALVFRFEAQDRAALERIKESMRKLVQSVVRNMDVPF